MINILEKLGPRNLKSDTLHLIDLCNYNCSVLGSQFVKWGRMILLIRAVYNSSSYLRVISYYSD